MLSLDSWPRITDELSKIVNNQLSQTISIYDRSGIFEEFENNIRKFFNTKYALLFNSGTEALHALYYANGLVSDSNVVCPNFTFFATCTPLLHLNANITFIDCDDTYNISTEKLREYVHSDVDAIVVTHMWGLPCNMKEVVAIARENNAILLEDCSHAHGAKLLGKMVGTFGDGAAFSIQGKKLITGGEGGVLITDDRNIYERALLFGHYNKRCKEEISKNKEYYKFATTGAGLKLRAHPLAIAIANFTLSKFDEYNIIRAKYAAELTDIFENLKNITIPSKNNFDRVWYAFNLYLSDQVIVKNLIDDLNSYGLCFDAVGSTMPMHMLPIFKNTKEILPNYSGNIVFNSISNSEKLYKTSIKCPVSPYEDELQELRKNNSKIKEMIRRKYE